MNPLTLVKRIYSLNSKEIDLGISNDASWHANNKRHHLYFHWWYSFRTQQRPNKNPSLSILSYGSTLIFFIIFIATIISKF